MDKVGSGTSYLVWYVLSRFHNFSFGESDCGSVAWAQFCTRSGHHFFGKYHEVSRPVSAHFD